MSDNVRFKLLTSKEGRRTPNNIPLGNMTSDPQPDYGDTYRPSARHEALGRSVIPDYDQSIQPSKVLGAVNKAPLELSTPPDYDDSDEEEASIHNAKKNTISVFDKHPPAVAKKPVGGAKNVSPVVNSVQRKEPMEPSKKLVPESHTGLTAGSSVNIKDGISQVKNLALLPVLSLDTISDCIERRYKQDLIYTNCGEILISVNPFKQIELCSAEYFSKYTHLPLSDDPHLFAVSAKAYKYLLMTKQNQVILVSGESGAGKTEATKLLVRHLMSIAGSEYATLQDIIIKVNPLLEAFGNAKTTLNYNSSRFAKYLSLNINANGKIESARIKDYMLEKSRVVHQEVGERNFHAFYAFLTGASDDTLDSVFINRSDKFRITGPSLSREEKEHYQNIFKNQQSIFKLIKLDEEEIQDINIIIAAVLHLGNIEFVDSDNDCVVIKDEIIVHNVAALLNVDVTALTKIFIERSAKMGNGQVFQLSKNKKQAEDERDATAKALYERMFGWLVIKINQSLKAEKYSALASIGILDICGFEDLTFNSFEQLCINLVNEELQNFMNKRVIEDDLEMYRNEGLEIEDVNIEGINNDKLLGLFKDEKSGILQMIDENTKSGFSTDETTVAKLSEMFGNSGIFIPTSASTLEFSIRHFAGKVTYSAQSFLKKNMDTLSKDMMECLKSSQSTLIQDLFSVPETLTGSISMATFNFQGSKRPSKKFSRQISSGRISDSINRSRAFKDMNIKRPNQQTGDFANRSTHIKFFRNSLKELQQTMIGAHPYFVRCIKPNDSQMASRFQRDRVKKQLQYNGVEEVARIRTCGFPFRYPKEDFKKLYEKIARVNTYYGQDHVQNIFRPIKPDISEYKIGNTQVFLKDSVKRALDGELKKIEDEERRVAEAKRLQEEAKRLQEEAEEREKIAVNELFQPQYHPIRGNSSSSSLTTIVEVPTPASHVDNSIYNSCPGSSVSRESTISTTEEDSEQENATEDAQDDDKPPEEKMNAAWDITQELTEEEERRDVHEQPILMVLKSIIYILLFVVILGTFTIQKVSFLLLVRELAPGAKVSKNPDEFQTVSYVLLIIAICVPYILGWLVTVAKLCFGNFKRPSLPTWIWVFVVENLHTVGMCLLVFRILRHLDVIRSAMLLTATAIVPAILKTTMASSDYNIKGRFCLQCDSNGLVKHIIRIVLDTLAMLVQISAIPLVLLMDYFTDESDNLLSDHWRIVELVASFILISVSQWENFTDGRLFCELGEKNWFKNAILKVRYELQMGRHYPYLIAYLWKIGLTVLLAYLLSDKISFSYYEAFATLSKNKTELKAVSAVIALTIAAFVAFYVSFGACMFQMQIVSLAIPACLATPAAIGLFYLNCEYNFLGAVTSLQAKCPADLISDRWYHFLFGGAWWLSFLVVTRHIWRPQVDRTANMARVFLNPVYCGILTAESIMMNRRRNPCRVYEEPQVNDVGEIQIVYYKLRGMNKLSKEDDDNEEDETEEIDEETPKEEKSEVHPATPMLYACATMWHETRVEMVQLLKSLHRLDRDQWIRRLANEKVKGYDPEFYNFEAHIFFDDAMEPDDDDEQVPNRWVKELVACMDIACSSVHGKPMKVHPPMKVPTPYGGQLIWQMPGENLLFVHMKDIRKIRNRKRWSQVMYMYYLLGYRHIMASKHELLERLKEVNQNQGNHGLNISEINYLLGEESALRAQNTFILALDGDTDFSPGAIKILLDRMKDDNVGAACGRIHPIGNGPMVWYQKFEYAIGHWLQKAAEHVFGCVLCSPGCFSLFRAAALMDTNVMKKYTTEPTEPGHHLQYDQGEDRWLCTLMLQQGYRIEYAAAADAWTYAPEGFFEFFNQRRRWMPSTIANILDLLGSATMTTKRNANMSRPYIGYQWLLMLMTVLGPGTIIMMIAGAVKLVFRFTLVEAYLFATIPAAFYTFLCFWCSSKIQLIVAAILSVIYTFIMMIVLVGTIITATTENIFNPSVIVIVMLIGIFTISGVCHPQEIWCLVHGIMYLLTIPSGYLLLVIYSICNLNDVSWGTREVPTKAQRLEMERKKKEKEEQEKNKPKKGFLAKLFNRGEEHIRDLTKLLKTLVPQKAESPQQQLGIAVQSTEPVGEADNKVVNLLAKIDFTLDQILKKTGHSAFSEAAPLSSVVVSQPQGGHRVQQPSQAATTLSLRAQPESQPAEAKRLKSALKKSSKTVVTKKSRDELINPIWASDKGLGNGLTIRGNREEIQFWTEFITKYLLPIRPTPEEKKKIADGLRDLRNSSAFGLIIINLLWMALNFMFQLTNAARFAIGYSYSGHSYKIEESVLGLGFVILLLLLLLIQMVGMFIHRMGTLQHLLAITEIKICKRKEDSTYNEKRDREDVIRRIKEVLKLPLLGDAGATTVPPAPTAQSSNWGVTFAPRSSMNTFGQDEAAASFRENLDKTLKNSMFAPAQHSFMDPRNRRTMNSVKQRMSGGVVRQKLKENVQLGKTLLPHLPPRGKSVNQPMVLQANKWGFTSRELRNANIDAAEDNQPSMFSNLGPMGRTLYQKSMMINEETVRNSNINWSWNDSDVHRTVRQPNSIHLR